MSEWNKPAKNHQDDLTDLTILKYKPHLNKGLVLNEGQGCSTRGF